MTYKRRRLATLDLGTNSLLMLVAERNEEGKIKILLDDSAMPRLGEGLRATGKISPQVMDRTLNAMKELLKKAEECKANEIFITATSAVREASNQKEFLSRFFEIVGREIEILPPSEEARLTFLSVTSERGHEDCSMVVDIGGGSTEITWGIGARFDGGRSLNLGTVKLLEGHLENEIPTQANLDSTRKEIDTQLSRITPLGQLDHYYGTAGSFTHLASIDLELAQYSPDDVAGHKITQERVSEWIKRLSKMSREERLLLPGLDPRRVDVLLPGMLIIERLLDKFRNDSFQVFDRGIRFGKLFDELKKFVPPVESL